MGSVYLTELPHVLDEAGLDVVVLDGYETRSRSTGGYDPALPAPVALWVHHTAGGLLSGELAGALHGALAHESKPIDNFRLGRSCTVYADAAGASNTEGQGGPWGPLLPGPGNYANPRCIGLECDNNGIGEPWSDDMQDALLLFCITVYVYGVRHWGWEPEVPWWRLGAHFEWAPTRKIDPAGPSRWMRADDRYMRWDMDLFRADVRAGVAAALAPKPDPKPPVVTPPTTPTPPPAPLPEAPITPGADMSQVTQLVEVKGAIFAVVDHGVSKYWIARADPDGPGPDKGSVAHVAWRWRANGTHDGTNPVIHKITDESTMHGLGPVTNCNVPSAEHGGATLIQLGWDQYGWRD